MRNWDDAKIQVALADAHRLANVLAIGQQLFAAKTDCARGGSRPGSKLQQRGPIVAPIVRQPVFCSCRRPRRQNLHVFAARDGGSYIADLKCALFLLIANRLFQRQNDKLLPQARQK